MTVVPERTDITIVAGGTVEQVQAALSRVTRISGANAIVVTGKRLGGETFPALAVVIHRTGIAVAAGTALRLMRAFARLDATIRRAWIAVIAIQGWATDAETINALVVDCAGISISAGSGDYGVGASSCRHTAIRGAWILIVAVHGSGRNTSSRSTVVPGRAAIPVVAFVTVGDVFASNCGVADIVGTAVAVIAGEGAGPRYTQTALTGVTEGANVGVGASKPFVGGHDLTFAGKGFTQSLLAN